MRTISQLIAASTLLAPTVWASPFVDQRLTIPELIRRGAVESSSAIPSGRGPAVHDLLSETDLVVIGTVGSATGYLSQDETEIYTEVSLVDIDILFDRRAPHETAVLQSLRFRQRGGSVYVSGISFTQTEEALGPLQPGVRLLCLLRRVGDTYGIVGTWFGVFGISGGQVTPLVAIRDFAQEYRGRAISEVTDDIVRRARKELK